MNPLFEKIDEVLKSLGQRCDLKKVPYQYDDIAAAIKIRTNVDRIGFIGFPPYDSGECEIVGKIEIYEMHPAPYALPETKAEVYYLLTLDAPWQRLIICKELCQLLWLDGPSRVSTTDHLLELARGLVVPPGSQNFLPVSEQMTSERAAMFCSLEILCPHILRMGLMPKLKAGEITHADLANYFDIPESIVAMVFEERYLGFIEASRLI